VVQLESPVNISTYRRLGGATPGRTDGAAVVEADFRGDDGSASADPVDESSAVRILTES
jgi:hypothetical protein